MFADDFYNTKLGGELHFFEESNYLKTMFHFISTYNIYCFIFKHLF